jgi:hypothetical protein
VTVGDAATLGLGLGAGLSLIGSVDWLGAGGSARTASLLAKIPASPPPVTETPISAAATTSAAARGTR